MRESTCITNHECRCFLLGLFDFLVAAEEFAHTIGLCFGISGKRADQRNDHHGNCHSGNTHFRGLGCCGRETGVQGDDQSSAADSDQTGKDTGKSTGLGNLLREQTPDVGTDEASGYNTP